MRVLSIPEACARNQCFPRKLSLPSTEVSLMLICGSGPKARRSVTTARKIHDSHGIQGYSVCLLLNFQSVLWGCVPIHILTVLYSMQELQSQLLKTYSWKLILQAHRWYTIYIYILDKYLDASVGVYFFNMNLDIVRQWIICLERKNTLNINNTAAATLGLLGFFISFFFFIPSENKAGVKATDAQMLLVHIWVQTAC